jgi:hypothetical protein
MSFDSKISGIPEVPEDFDVSIIKPLVKDDKKPTDNNQ